MDWEDGRYGLEQVQWQKNVRQRRSRSIDGAWQAV